MEEDFLFAIETVCARETDVTFWYETLRGTVEQVYLLHLMHLIRDENPWQIWRAQEPGNMLKGDLALVTWVKTLSETTREMKYSKSCGSLATYLNHQMSLSMRPMSCYLDRCLGCRIRGRW